MGPSARDGVAGEVVVAVKQQTMFGPLTAKRRRDGRWDLVKPCGATYGPYAGEDIEGYVRRGKLIKVEGLS